MFLALEFFLVGKLLARRDDLVLRLDVRGIRSGRLGVCLSGIAATEAASDPADLQAGGKAFEVAFLLIGKVDGERIDFHRATKLLRPRPWLQRKWNDRLKLIRRTPPGSIQGTVRPASLLRKSILDMGPPGICDSWLQCNIQVACHLESLEITFCFNRLHGRLGALNLASLPISWHGA